MPFLYLLLFIMIYLIYSLEILQLRKNFITLGNSLFILAEYNCAHRFNYNQKTYRTLFICA